MLFSGALLEYSNIHAIHNKATFFLSRAIDHQNEKETDCFNELTVCLYANDLNFFVESISSLDLCSYTKLEISLLDCFIRLMIGHTTNVLILLIRYHETIEKKYFATVNYSSFEAKKVSQYGHKKLVELESIAALLDDVPSLNKDNLVQIAEKIESFYGFNNNCNRLEADTINLFERVLCSFFTYKKRIEKVCRSPFYGIKNWLVDQTRDTKKRFLAAGLLSYGSLMAVVYYFFGHIALIKSDFVIDQSLLEVSPAKVALTKEDSLLKGQIPGSFGESFNVNYFAQKESEYKKSYYPMSKLAEIFYACDVVLKAGFYYFGQVKDLLAARSKMVQELENSVINGFRRVAFSVQILGQYVQGIGELSSILIFFYAAYQFEKILKISAFDDFKMAFELFEKELYNELAMDLHKSEKILYLELLLMHEGKKVLSSQQLCMLQNDIIHIKNFKSWDLVEVYLNKMKQSYQVSS